jgi:hypothetical protein
MWVEKGGMRNKTRPGHYYIHSRIAERVRQQRKNGKIITHKWSKSRFKRLYNELTTGGPSPIRTVFDKEDFVLFFLLCSRLWPPVRLADRYTAPLT